MDDVKRTYREGEVEAKEAWRKRDGESISDKVANAGDEIRKELGNLGDTVDEDEDEAARGARRETPLDRDYGGA